MRIFNDEPVQATYLKFSAGLLYDARIVIFGVSASQAMPVCEEMANLISITATCIQGTEGQL